MRALSRTGDLEQLRAFLLAAPATNDINLTLLACWYAIFYGLFFGINVASSLS